MKITHTVFAFVFMLLMVACSSTNTNSQGVDHTSSELKSEVNLDGLSKAYFASGCFWCVEAVYESVEGVAEAISGYSGGKTLNPTYEQIGTGRTGHSEAVEVYYDPEVVSYETLVEVYYGSHDPTTPNQQGPDRGSQYRSMIYYQNEDERKIAEKWKAAVASDWNAPIVTEIVPFEKFWMAEDYHQDFEKKNPNQGYVVAVSIPRLRKFQAKFPHLLKKEHQ